jgi:Leucine-rich repeat (LRR) protein
MKHRIFFATLMVLLALNPLDGFPAETVGMASVQQEDRSVVMDLSRKNLQHIPSAVFTCTNLTELRLNYNDLEDVPSAIGGLTALRKLEIGYNPRIRSLPAEIGSLKNLEYLYVYETSLRELPPEIGHLKKLKRLTINNFGPADIRNKGEPTFQMVSWREGEARERIFIPAFTFPPEIGQLENLELLFCRNHQLSHLPPEIGKLKKLKHLALDHGTLRTLPPEISGMESLERIGLADNPLLSALPPEIGQLKNLRSLEIIHNHTLESLPPELGRCENLRVLRLTNTNVKRIPPELNRCQKLEFLSLQCWDVEAFPEGLFRLPALRGLIIGAAVETLPGEIAEDADIELLSLHNCKRLATLPVWLLQLKKLRCLDVRGISLRALPEWMSECSSLKVVWVNPDTDTSSLPAGVRVNPDTTFDTYWIAATRDKREI